MSQPQPQFDMLASAPHTRGGCLNNKRPCPWIRCKHHMIWVFYTKSTFGKNSDDQMAAIICDMKESCTLDMADLGGCTLEQIAQVLGVTREMVRQIQDKSLNRLKHATRQKYLKDFVEP